MLEAIRRLFPPVQRSACAGCGRAVAERRRRPCPACGSLNRLVSVTALDGFTTTDRTA